MSGYKSIIFCLIIVLIFTFVSCNINEKNNINLNDKSYDWLPSSKKESEVLLYDHYNYRIFTYDINEKSIVEVNNSQNYFQMEFNNLSSNVYTTGHSIDQNFKIFKIENEKPEILYVADPLSAIFPLAYKDSSTAFFTQYYYDKDGTELKNKRQIIVFDLNNRKLQSFTNSSGFAIVDGVYLNNMLYFSSYIAEKDNFNIYTLDVSDSYSKPKLFLEGIHSSEIYENNNEILFSNETEIYNDNQRYTKKSENYFYKGKLIQMSISKDAGLILEITDTNSKEVEFKSENFVSFMVKGNTIVIYEKDNINTFETT